MRKRFQAVMRGATAAALAIVALTGVAGMAQAKAVLKDGFAFPADRTVKIAVFRPDVRVGTMRAAGLDEPNADWTATARTNIQEAMKSQASGKGISFTFLSDLDGADGEMLDGNRALFIAVASAAATHSYPGNRLPTKAVEPTAPGGSKTWRMDWTLGPQVSAMKRLSGADYALFFFSHDAYSSSGRKAAVLFAAMWGVSVQAGIHEGYAGLVDLNTGDLVWVNSDPAMGGDPREADGANKRVGQLLAGFPGLAANPWTAETPSVVPGAAPATK